MLGLRALYVAERHGLERGARAVARHVLQPGVHDDRVLAGAPRPGRHEAPHRLARLQRGAARQAVAADAPHADQARAGGRQWRAERDAQRLARARARRRDLPGAGEQRPALRGLHVPALAQRRAQLRIVHHQRHVLARVQCAPQREVRADARLHAPGMQQQRDRAAAVAGQRQVEEGALHERAAAVEQAHAIHGKRMRQRAREPQLDAQQVLRHAVAGGRDEGARRAGRGRAAAQRRRQRGGAQGRTHGFERAASSG